MKVYCRLNRIEIRPDNEMEHRYILALLDGETEVVATLAYPDPRNADPQPEEYMLILHGNASFHDDTEGSPT